MALSRSGWSGDPSPGARDPPPTCGGVLGASGLVAIGRGKDDNDDYQQLNEFGWAILDELARLIVESPADAAPKLDKLRKPE